MVIDRTQDESELVVAACGGDKEALQGLLKANWGWLKGLVYSVLGGAQDLDDVMQEICLRVITRIGTLREPRAVSRVAGRAGPAGGVELPPPQAAEGGPVRRRHLARLRG